MRALEIYCKDPTLIEDMGASSHRMVKEKFEINFVTNQYMTHKRLAVGANIKCVIFRSFEFYEKYLPQMKFLAQADIFTFGGAISQRMYFKQFRLFGW